MHPSKRTLCLLFLPLDSFFFLLVTNFHLPASPSASQPSFLLSVSETTVCEYWNIMDLSVRACSILHIFPYVFKVCAHRRCSHAASLKRSCWGFSTTIPPKGLLPWKLTKKRLLYSTLFYSSVVWSSLKAFFHPVCPSFSFGNHFFSLSRICLRIKHLNGLNGVQSLGFHNGSGYAVALCV